LAASGLCVLRRGDQSSGGARLLTVSAGAKISSAQDGVTIRLAAQGAFSSARRRGPEGQARGGGKAVISRRVSAASVLSGVRFERSGRIIHRGHRQTRPYAAEKGLREGLERNRRGGKGRAWQAGQRRYARQTVSACGPRRSWQAPSHETPRDIRNGAIMYDFPPPVRSASRCMRLARIGLFRPGHRCRPGIPAELVAHAPIYGPGGRGPFAFTNGTRPATWRSTSSPASSRCSKHWCVEIGAPVINPAASSTSRSAAASWQGLGGALIRALHLRNERGGSSPMATRAEHLCRLAAEMPDTRRSATCHPDRGLRTGRKRGAGEARHRPGAPGRGFP